MLSHAWSCLITQIALHCKAVNCYDTPQEACQWNIKWMLWLCHAVGGKQWQESCHEQKSSESPLLILFFFKVKNKLTPDIKYYKLKISSTSHRQYGVLHISSEALLLVWSADTWSRLTFLASYYLLSETHRQLPHTADWTIAATFNLPPRTSAEMFSCASQWFRTN